MGHKNLPARNSSAVSGAYQEISYQWRKGLKTITYLLLCRLLLRLGFFEKGFWFGHYECILFCRQTANYSFVWSRCCCCKSLRRGDDSAKTEV